MYEAYAHGVIYDGENGNQNKYFGKIVSMKSMILSDLLHGNDLRMSEISRPTTACTLPSRLCFFTCIIFYPFAYSMSGESLL